MKWTREAYEAYEARRAASRAKPKPAVRKEPLGEETGKAGDTSRVLVRITSFRRRLLDPDNLCPKYFIDCLRYAEIIPDDRAEDIRLEVSQVKVKSKSDERTEIEIEKIEKEDPGPEA